MTPNGELATKADLAALEGRMNERMSGRMNSMEERIVETMRDIQTELLKAFYSYAKSTDLKLKDGEIADFILRQRMTAMESRLTEVEKRLNMPSAESGT